MTRDNLDQLLVGLANDPPARLLLRLAFDLDQARSISRLPYTRIYRTPSLTEGRLVEAAENIGKCYDLGFTYAAHRLAREVWESLSLSGQSSWEGATVGFLLGRVQSRLGRFKESRQIARDLLAISHHDQSIVARRLAQHALMALQVRHDSFTWDSTIAAYEGFATVPDFYGWTNKWQSLAAKRAWNHNRRACLMAVCKGLETGKVQANDPVVPKYVAQVGSSWQECGEDHGPWQLSQEVILLRVLAHTDPEDALSRMKSLMSRTESKASELLAVGRAEVVALRLVGKEVESDRRAQFWRKVNNCLRAAQKTSDRSGG